jgi:hypothetical protein
MGGYCYIRRSFIPGPSYFGLDELELDDEGPLASSTLSATSGEVAAQRYSRLQLVKTMALLSYPRQMSSVSWPIKCDFGTAPSAGSAA